MTVEVLFTVFMSCPKQLGVSPWYWWMDVPVVKRAEAYILPGIYTDGEPAVKYRGILFE